MKPTSRYFLLCLSIPLATCTAQPTQTALDFIPPFNGPFGYGANMGYYPPHYYDKELAALVHGTPDGQVPGIGVTTIRPGLYEHFLDYWGYDIRLDAFKYYQEIGLEDLVVIIGYPSEAHRDKSFYCPGSQAETFQGMYEPIWDNGENGTPVNDANLYALYVWQMATRYKDYVKYWEVWNEPDVDNGNAWAPPGTPGNWWDNAPQPCETKLHTPIFFYVRMLRITYEVIKSIDPQDFVCVGGLGWPSYLDVICRYSDDPFTGAVSAEYPRKGGAYFDVMDFHSYPHIDNSLREWSNDIGGFKHFRHSDRAVDGVWQHKADFDKVLKKYGFNGVTHPQKRWLLSEVNIPRKAFGDYIGSDQAQVNFIIKTLVTAQREQVDQVHIYSLADEKPEAQATNEFAYMGLFKNLDGFEPYHCEMNSVATAYHTTSQLLRGKTYNAAQTNRLKLPANVRGAAFKAPNGQYTYVLWAKTHKDQEETAHADYAFPDDLGLDNLDQKFWHFSQTGVHSLVTARQVKLTGDPVFLTNAGFVVTDEYPKQPKVNPNPLPGGYGVYSFWMFEDGAATIEVFDAVGRHLQDLAVQENFVAGPHQILLDWSALPKGVYHIRLSTIEGEQVVSAVKQ